MYDHKKSQAQNNNENLKRHKFRLIKQNRLCDSVSGGMGD